MNPDTQFPAYERPDSWRRNTPAVKRARKPEKYRCETVVRAGHKCQRDDQHDETDVHTATLLLAGGKVELWARQGTEVWRVVRTEQPGLF